MFLYVGAEEAIMRKVEENVPFMAKECGTTVLSEDMGACCRRANDVTPRMVACWIPAGHRKAGIWSW
jgi:hypothetical protein